jgi:hypothetical protein
VRRVQITIMVNVPDNTTLEYLQYYTKQAFEGWCGHHDPKTSVLPPGSFAERGTRAKVKVRLAQ